MSWYARQDVAAEWWADSWKPDVRPLYDRSVEEIAEYERSLGALFFPIPTRTARLTRDSLARCVAGMRYPLRGPALDRPEGTYR